jgi:hypothetical protein
MVPSGVVIDGAVYPLAGQPPLAQSNGWGDMSWLASPFYWASGGVRVVTGQAG